MDSKQASVRESEWSGHFRNCPLLVILNFVSVEYKSICSKSICIKQTLKENKIHF